MKFKIPTRQKIYDEEADSLITKEGELFLDLDTSLFAEERWERNFPEMAKKYKLFDYIQYISNAKVDNNTFNISLLKVIYCFFESDDVSDFKSFIRLFDFADTDYTQKVIDKIAKMLNLIISSSTVKN